MSREGVTETKEGISGPIEGIRMSYIGKIISKKSIQGIISKEENRISREFNNNNKLSNQEFPRMSRKVTRIFRRVRLSREGIRISKDEIRISRKEYIESFTRVR